MIKTKTGSSILESVLVLTKLAATISIFLTFTGCASHQKGSAVSEESSEEAIRAKQEIFAAMHEIYGLGFAKPERVSFWFEACHDEGHGPFRATMSSRMIITEPWSWKQIDEEYRKGLLRIPAWSGGTGGWKTHSDVITRGDIHLTMPYRSGDATDKKKNIYGINLDGPCTIKQNMSQERSATDVPKDEGGFPWRATDPQDYTKEFE